MTKKRSTARRLTAKERVLKKWPDAVSIGLGTTPTSGGYLAYAIYDGLSRRSKNCSSHALAWADAARRLP